MKRLLTRVLLPALLIVTLLFPLVMAPDPVQASTSWLDGWGYRVEHDFIVRRDC